MVQCSIGGDNARNQGVILHSVKYIPYDSPIKCGQSGSPRCAQSCDTEGQVLNS